MTQIPLVSLPPTIFGGETRSESPVISFARVCSEFPTVRAPWPSSGTTFANAANLRRTRTLQASGFVHTSIPLPTLKLTEGQVLVSFITSACLANISVCLYLLIVRSGRVLDGTYIPPGQTHLKRINPIDGWMKKKFSTPFVDFLLRSSWIALRIQKFENALFSFLLALADMQLVTGIAMQSAAIIQLHRQKITVYHFAIVAELGWLSSNVHLLALLAIRTRIVGSMKKGRRWIAPSQDGTPWIRRFGTAMGPGADMLVRVVSMLISAGLLLYCSYVAGADGWSSNFGCFADCGNQLRRGGSDRGWMIFNFFMIFSGYPRACLPLWPAAGRWWIDKLRHRFLDNRGLEGSQTAQKIPPWRKVLVIIYYFISSETTDVFWDGFLWFGLGVYWVFDNRTSMHRGWKYSTNIADEDDIDGFGQLVPILLLGMPFLQALQTYCGTCSVKKPRGYTTLLAKADT